MSPGTGSNLEKTTRWLRNFSSAPDSGGGASRPGRSGGSPPALEGREEGEPGPESAPHNKRVMPDTEQSMFGDQI